MTTSKTNMELATNFLIRDARGLNRDEKLFLFIVESRGVYTRSAANAYEEMGMSRKLFDKTRDSLEAKKLIWVKRFPKVGRETPPNHYKINKDELAKLIPTEPAIDPDEFEWTTGSDDVLTEHDVVPTAHNDVPAAHDRVPTAHETVPQVTTKITIREPIREPEDYQEVDLKAAPTAQQGVKEKASSSKGIDIPNIAASPPSPTSFDLSHSDSGSAAPSASSLTLIRGSAVDSKRDTDRGPAARAGIAGWDLAHKSAHSKYGHMLPTDVTSSELDQVIRQITKKEQLRQPVRVLDTLTQVRTANRVKSTV